MDEIKKFLKAFERVKGILVEAGDTESVKHVDVIIAGLRNRIKQPDNIKELVERLRDYDRSDTDYLMDKAADALEAQAAEIERLKKKLDEAVDDLMEVCVHPGEVGRRLKVKKWCVPQKEE